MRTVVYARAYMYMCKNNCNKYHTPRALLWTTDRARAMIYRHFPPQTRAAKDDRNLLARIAIKCRACFLRRTWVGHRTTLLHTHHHIFEHKLRVGARECVMLCLLFNAPPVRCRAAQQTIGARWSGPMCRCARYYHYYYYCCAFASTTPVSCWGT